MASTPIFSPKKPCVNIPSLFLLLTTLFCSFIPSSQAKIIYADHCGAVVRPSLYSGLYPDTTKHIYISDGYVSGVSSSSSPILLVPGQFSLYTKDMYSTQTPGVFHLNAYLSIQRQETSVEISSSRRTHHRVFHTTVFSSVVSFDLSGFWSESTGKLCMVGTGSYWSKKEGTSVMLSAVFNLNYPKYSNISTSIVSGKLESLDASDRPSYFDAISVLGYGYNNYSYTKISRVREIFSHVNLLRENLLGFEKSADGNYLPWPRGQFRLEYGRDCSATNCGPFSSKKSLDFLPSFMTMDTVDSTKDGKVHMHIGFTNSSSNGYYTSLVPEKSLVAEGYWDWEKKHLCLLACPVLKNSSVGECTIALSFWFPAVFTIKDRSNIVGRIWSVRRKSDPEYFSTISFRSVGSDRDILPGVKYEYTEVDSLRKTCANHKVNDSQYETYLDENSIEDLRFDFSVKNKGSTLWGYATPMSFGESFFGNSFLGISSEISFTEKSKKVSFTIWDVSYIISYQSHNSSLNTDTVTDIAAEGVYNSGTGTFCMVGCRDPISSSISQKGKVEDFADCQIQIDIQLSPLNPDNREPGNGSISGTRHLNGTIKSRRKKPDPLYFDPLELSSYTMYTTEARATIKRMDMEIIMVVTSLTLSCVFIILQIFHVRKHQDVMTSISITMLVVLTLGHMVPLVLNFEALLINKRRNVMFWSGGWLEVNEVLVRVMTMVAFLLQFRLLQLVWSARSSKEGRKGLFIAEGKLLRFCLPLYFAGALIAWFVHARSSKTQRGRLVLDDLISYVGLILDGFLLPQIILNIISNSKDKALAPLFYIGTTAVRALPHFYDVYRARNYVPYYNFSYIYASPERDYYSTAWDIVIPLGGLVFIVLIFLQQQFGGTCFLPQRFRKASRYEAVPIISL